MTFIHQPVYFPKLTQVNPPNGMRYYEHEDGSRFTSVTSFLSQTSDKSFLDVWVKRVGEEEAEKIKNYSAARGTALHTMVESFLHNQEVGNGSEVLSLSQLRNRKSDPVIQILFNSIKPHLMRVNNIRCLETPLYSRRLGLAGTVDLIAEYDGKLSVIDLKTSGRAKKEEHMLNYFLQETIYAEMFFEHTGIQIEQIVTLMAVENEIDPTVVIKNPRDYLTELDNRVMLFSGGR